MFSLYSFGLKIELIFKRYHETLGENKFCTRNILFLVLNNIT